jgi:FkbM family methyltransferase
MNLKFCLVEIIGFDPLVERLHEREAAEGMPGVTLLPYAIGDGDVHTLHVNNEDATSSLFPLNLTHNDDFDQLCTLRTVRSEEVATRRLDDVLSAGPVDFLKLDVQGAELMVLQGAEHTLETTAAIHCEVEFSPIYVGQPLYPKIHQYLADRGFALIDLLVPGRYHYRIPSGRSAPDRLLWTDAVFFRQTGDRQLLAAQALVAGSVYRKPTVSAPARSCWHIAILSGDRGAAHAGDERPHARDKDYFKNRFFLLVPAAYQADAASLLTQIDAVLAGYVRGQIVIAVGVGVQATLVMLILDARYAVILGLFTAVTQLIPISPACWA